MRITEGRPHSLLSRALVPTTQVRTVEVTTGRFVSFWTLTFRLCPVNSWTKVYICTGAAESNFNQGVHLHRRSRPLSSLRHKEQELHHWGVLCLNSRANQCCVTLPLDSWRWGQSMLLARAKKAGVNVGEKHPAASKVQCTQEYGQFLQNGHHSATHRDVTGHGQENIM